ncbi:MAG: hypothetical protein ABIR18_09355 [Chitinophagaceae bacterium]
MTTESTNGPDQQKDVIADYANEIQQIQMEGYERAIRKARNALFWAGGLIFFWEMVAMFRADLGFDIFAFGFALIIGGIFVLLAFWTKKKPYSAILTGIAVFIAYLALVVVINGMVEGSEGVLKALVGGIIIKIVILVNLILPIKDAKALQEARKQNF